MPNIFGPTCSGLEIHKDPKLCLVAGCRKKAMYRPYNKSRRDSGYCSAHRAFALRPSDVQDQMTERFVRNIE